jgi:hypothetical protein
MNFTLTSLRTALLLAIAVTLLAGCQTYGPSERFIGLSREQVIAEMGKPYPTPPDLSQAQRLDFPRGPFGMHTYSLQFDADGKVISYSQLLTEENFKKITPGMDVSEVTEIIGVSRDQFGLARNRGYVWNFRYITPLCRSFQIEFTAEHKVRSTGYGAPPECRPKIVAGP